MKTSSAKGRLNVWMPPVAFLIVAGGIWQQREIGRLQTEYAALLDLARSSGINADAPLMASTKPYPRPDLAGEARALADALIHRASDGGLDRTDWGNQVELVDRLEALNPAQLDELIGIFLKTDKLPDYIRIGLIFQLVDCFANDFPEEALVRMAEVKSQLPENFGRYDFATRQGKIASRLAERSPEAAWKWFLETGNSSDEERSVVRIAVLGGIARRDPAAALRRAEEAGVRETYYLVQYCDTLDQKVTALKALRSWSGDDDEKRKTTSDYIRKQTLKRSYEEPVAFGDAIDWIEQAGLATDEIGFLADRSSLDLCYYIEPRDTGKWIEWLDRTFPQEETTQQIKHLVEDSRTSDAAKAWLATLPPEQASALEKRLADE